MVGDDGSSHADASGGDMVVALMNKNQNDEKSWSLSPSSSQISSTTANWIVLNSKGQCSIVDIDKHRIMNLAQIHYRDFRILDPLLSYPSAILARDKAILLNLEHIKAIITAEEVLVRDPMDENVVPVVEELKRRLARMCASHQQNIRDESISMEFEALEVALEGVCSFLAARATELEMATYISLEKLTTKISSLNLDRVRKLKSTTTTLTAKVHKVRDELERLLDDEHDMAELYLSRKLLQLLSSSPPQPHDDDMVSDESAAAAANKASSICPTLGSKVTTTTATTHHAADENEDVKELEMLLEAYFEQIDRTLTKLMTLREYIDGTEDYINIQIDNRRNNLIKLELVLSSGNFGLSLFSLVNDTFGLNFPYSWNKNHDFMFKWVVIVTTTCSACIFLMIIGYAWKKGLL